uniref:Uncharacterized protein n=1 Tax=Arundo donax TaxID=35708 RepID=A0A0A9FAF8_ARUDO
MVNSTVQFEFLLVTQVMSLLYCYSNNLTCTFIVCYICAMLCCRTFAVLVYYPLL